MKRNLLVILAVPVLVLTAFSQTPSDLYRGLKYDKSTETTVYGTVEEVQDFDCPVSMAYGNHLVIKTLTGQVVVHTAPVKFLKTYQFDLKKGDTLEVLGSKQKDAAGRDTVVAREVVRERATFRFRDEKGKPYW
jgi:hypothetical protein